MSEPTAQPASVTDDLFQEDATRSNAGWSVWKDAAILPGPEAGDSTGLQGGQARLPDPVNPVIFQQAISSGAADTDTFSQPSISLVVNYIAATGTIFAGPYRHSGHTQLVYDDGDPETRLIETEVRAPSNLIFGNWVFEPFGQLHGANTEYISDNDVILDPDRYGITTLILQPYQTAEYVWQVLDSVRQALVIAAPGIDYSARQNSNSYTRTLLYSIGIELDDVLPAATPQDVDRFPGSDRNVLLGSTQDGTDNLPIDMALFGAAAGSQGADFIRTGIGNDSIEGGGGDDRLDGGEQHGSGGDTAVFSGMRWEYVIDRVSTAQVLVAHVHGTGIDGTDRLINFEFVQFADGMLDLGTIPVDKPNSPPQGQPAILGTAQEGQTLEVDVSAVADADGIVPGSGSFQWLADGIAIADATGPHHVLGQQDVGAVISVRYGYTDLDGRTESVISTSTTEVERLDHPTVGVIVISGLPELGETLIADISGITDADGLDEAGTVFFWTRDGIVIEGATQGSHVISEDDLGTTVMGGAVFMDLFGSVTTISGPSVYINSPATGVVEITGLAEAGAVVAADLSGIVEPDGTIAGLISYQWQRNGQDIPGPLTDGPDYLLTGQDVGAQITVVVTFLDEGGTEEMFVSNHVVPIDPDQLINGTPGPDNLSGETGNDTINGLAGDDTLNGGADDDLINGGEGTDTAVFAGAQAGYTLTLGPSETIITHRVADGEGTDRLTGIELLDFGTEVPLFEGSPMNLDIFDGPTGLSAAEFGAIIELYIGYFNRAPDALGLCYWGTEFSNGFSILDMATSFFAQPETRATYASVLDENDNLDITDPAKVDAFVTAVYGNVLGRLPDTPGFDYWTNELETDAGVTPALFILSVMGGAKYPSNPTPQTTADQVYLATKSDLGAYFAVIKGMSDLDDAAAAMALFDGTEDSVTATLAAIDGHYADALDADTGDFLMPLVGVIDDPFAPL